MKIKISISILILLSVSVLVAPKSFAQEQRLQQIFNVSPVIIETNLKTGVQTFKITVKNLLPQPLGINATPGDFLAPDEQIIGKQNQNSLLQYSSVLPADFIINSGESKEVILTLKIPNNLKDGGYYEAVYLTPFFTKNTQQTSVLSKVAVLVLGTKGNINYEDLSSKTNITSLHFDTKDDIKNDIDTTFNVSNNYFTHFTAKPFLTINPLFGKDQKFELSEKKILPGKERKWEEKLGVKKLSFFNTANLAVSVGQGNFIYKKTFIILAPWKEIAAILILIFVLFIVKLRGRQIKKGLGILFKGK